MIFKISNTALHSQLQLMKKMIPVRSTVPILESILFRVEGKTLFLISSDGDNRLETRLELEEHDGKDLSFAVNPKFVLDPLREVPEQLVSFDVNETDLNVEVSYLNGRFVFRADDATDYPEMSDIPEDVPKLRLPAKSLEEGINLTFFAAGADSTREVTKSLLIDAKADGLTIVGTDGFLMSMYTDKNLKCSEPTQLILARKPADFLRGLLYNSGDEEELDLLIGEKQLSIRAEDYEMRCSLVAGNYPKYSSVIPRNHTNILEVDRDRILSALRRVSIFTNKSLPIIAVELSKDNILVKANDLDFNSSASESIEASYDGAEQKLSFRANQIMDVITHYNVSDNIRIAMGDVGAPALIAPAPQPEDKHVEALVMPLVV